MGSSPQQSLSTTVRQVSELTEDIKYLLEDNFSGLWVEGEISNFSRPASGHCYFTLKDDGAQLNCVLWRWMAEELFFTPQDGMKVRAYGDVSVYPPRGQYQLKVRTMRPAGEGELNKAFEELKQKLQQEGLFDEAHKKTLPQFPRRIGIVTSGTGAALQDMLSTIGRRFPCTQVQVLPVQVQGAAAGKEIAAAIETFNNRSTNRPDLLIIGRGGGSIEDLWAFNEEAVARTVFNSQIPIVSAVGHETDFTITDFVADRRAATPTMAGEVAVPDQRDLILTLRTQCNRLKEQIDRVIRDRKYQVQLLTRSHAFRRPVDRLQQLSQKLDDLTNRLPRAMQRYLKHQHTRLQHLQHRLESLNPQAPLQRGYVWVEKDDRPVNSSKQLEAGDAVKLCFQDGTRKARIE